MSFAKRQQDLKDPGVRRRIEEYLRMHGMVYFSDQGNGAWMAYVCYLGRGLTDCEWLIPGTVWVD